MMIWYDDSRKCFAWSTGNVVRGTQEMFCVEQRIRLPRNTGNVLRGTQEVSCLEHRKCFVGSTGNALRGAHECFACNRGSLVFAVEETYDDSS